VTAGIVAGASFGPFTLGLAEALTALGRLQEAGPAPGAGVVTVASGPAPCAPEWISDRDLRGGCAPG
jgi:hypothetical protein